MVSVCQSHPEIPMTNLKDLDPASASIIASPEERLELYRGEYYTRLYEIAKYTILKGFFARNQGIAEESFFAFLRQNPHRSSFLDKIFTSFPSWLSEYLPEKPWLTEEANVLVAHYFWLHYTEEEGNRKASMDIESLFLDPTAFTACPTGQSDLYGLIAERSHNNTNPSGIAAIKMPANSVHMTEVDSCFFPIMTALNEALPLAQAIAFIDQDCDPNSLRDFVASLTPCLSGR